MNKDKVYLKGYVIGRAADTLGYHGLMVQLENLDIVEIDKNLVHKEIGESQKPVVLQFVADWYEEHKDDFEGNLLRCIDRMPDLFSGEELSDFEEWIVDDHTKPFQILVNMHQFGYTVEKEKRFLVKMKGVDSRTNYLYYGEGSKTWLFKTKLIDGLFRKSHTRKQLEEAGFGDVFNSPLFEVEEVEG